MQPLTSFSHTAIDGSIVYIKAATEIEAICLLCKTRDIETIAELMPPIIDCRPELKCNIIPKEKHIGTHGFSILNPKSPTGATAIETLW